MRNTLKNSATRGDYALIRAAPYPAIHLQPDTTKCILASLLVRAFMSTGNRETILVLPLVSEEFPMSHIPGLIITRVIEEISRGSAVDIYKMAQEIKGHLPDYSFDEIARLVAEQVAVAHGAAVWEKTEKSSLLP